MRRYDVVFFDVGFTLMYFFPSLLELNLRALHEAGFNVSAERLLDARRELDMRLQATRPTATFPPTEEADRAREIELRRQLLHALGIESDKMLQRFMAREEAIYAEPGALRLYPEVKEVLRGLRAAGYRLGVISNWSWNLRARCAQLGIADDFDLILASAYAGVEKPHPAIFRLALESLQVAPKRALHVGDNYTADVLGARNAGLDAVLICRDEMPPMDETAVIRDLRELFPLLACQDAR